MTRRDFPLECNKCRKELTRSVTGLCIDCRAAPSVELVGDRVVIGNGYALSTQHALQLAHKLLDLLSPQPTPHIEQKEKENW